ncbi:MAG: large conductance mechanosensitive channel protein MscL [Arcanobacterium sp.]|nr:large conductance mechanosensitive channel protein MscL [Arcanobacterium sp.]MDY5589278.1 large conductance mechanosensitive channel protein MscL [Arcanobacterium sp.]
MFQGFKEFISRGNVIDLAVGVIIGGAFAPIVKTLADNVIMALIAAIFGKPNFDHVGEFVLNGAKVMPGTVITAIVNFLLIAVAVYFCIVVPMNKFRKTKEAEEVAEPSEDVALLTEIRDLLKRN